MKLTQIVKIGLLLTCLLVCGRAICAGISGQVLQHTPTPPRSLYNGNIAGQTMAIDTFQRLHKQYVYDQLNRILSAGYATVDAAMGGLSGIADYENRYTYDADGNIQTLLRMGNNTGSGAMAMDSLKYIYSSIHNDRLKDVLDSAANNYTNDIKQYTSPVASGRYRHDAIGNLIANRESGQDIIKWNLYNKVSKVENYTDSSTIDYDYDGAGNRVGKLYTKNLASGARIITGEYYMRDAQGNILATYASKEYAYNVGASSTFALAAHDVYGSSRLGQKHYYGLEIGGSVDFSTILTGLYDTVRFYPHVPWYSLEYQDVIHTDSTNLYNNSYTGIAYGKHATGLREYEVPDHLGNVLVTLSDKRAGAEFLPIGGSILSPGGDAQIDTWKPIVTSAHDYYPFGQYMPGRYTEDTATQCFTTTYSGMGSVVVYKYLSGSSGTFTTSLSSSLYPPFTGFGSGSYSPYPGGGAAIISTGSPGGATMTVSGISVSGDFVYVEATSITGAHTHSSSFVTRMPRHGVCNANTIYKWRNVRHLCQSNSRSFWLAKER